MTTSNSGVKIYRQVRVEKITCDLGDEHKVPVYVERQIFETDEVYDFNDGYSISTMGLFKDEDGRVYREGRMFDTGRRYFYDPSEQERWEIRYSLPRLARILTADDFQVAPPSFPK